MSVTAVYLKHLEEANGGRALKKLAAMFDALPRQRGVVGK
jgi:hypothetical protein